MSRFILICMCVLCLGMSLSTTAQAQETRLPISVANPSAAPLTNHTVRVDLNATNAPGFDFTNNGDDIQVFDAAFNQIDFFVEDVDSVAQTAIVWIEVPSIPAGPSSVDVFLDYNNLIADVPSPLSDAAETFATEGFRYHTELHTDPVPGPESSAEGQATFDFDTIAAPGSGYGCTALDNIRVGNSDVFGSNGDIGFSVDTILIVPTAGTYEFRIGTDYGNGGELVVDGTTLEESWTEDIWYGFDLDSADTFVGSIFLEAGATRLSTLGFERCCDGTWDADVRLNGGTRFPFDTVNPLLELRAPSCPITNVTLGSTTTVPVTLSKFDSSKLGPFLRFNWQTADETFSAGFNLWTLDTSTVEEGELIALNRHLIRSKRFDSVQTQSYKYAVNTNNVDVDINNVVISSMDINGKQEFFGPFEIGEEYGADYQSQPIDWQAALNHFETAMRARDFVKTNNRWRKARNVNAASQSPEQEVVQVGVDADGIVSLSYEELLAQGVDWSGVNRNHIAVSHLGQGIPRVIRTSAKTRAARRLFGPGSAIDFVGLAPTGEPRIYNTERFYQISIDQSKVLTSRLNRRAASDPQAWYYQEQRQAEQNEYVVSSPASTPWMMNVMFRVNNAPSTSYSFTVSEELQPDVPSRLNVELAGLSGLRTYDVDGDGEFDPDHRARIFVNDVAAPFADVSFDGQVTESVALDLPAGVIQQGENTVRIELADTGHFFDATGIESIALNYPVKLSAAPPAGIDFYLDQSESDGLRFETSRRSDVVAYAYRNDFNLIRLLPRRVRGQSGSNGLRVFSVPFSAHQKSHYFLAHKGNLPKVASIEVFDRSKQIELRDTNLLIVSHPAFINEELETYAQQRRAQNVDSIIVSTADIATHYGNDIALHEAIKRFLIDADSAVDYQSVLLVGGHSYDYNHNLNDESINFIPTFYRPIGFSRFTPTDVPLVDFDNDNYPEKEIGRWPVRTAENLSTIISKSLQWADKSSARSGVGHRVLMVADAVTNLPFEDDLDQQLSLLNISDLNVGSIKKLYVDQIRASDQAPSSGFNEYVQTEVRNAIKDTDWLFYNGHGSPVSWSSSNLLTSESISDLGNADNPILITSMACHTTYYESPSHNSLAHQLLFSDGNGAVIIHGPSVVGRYDHQRILAEDIVSNSDQDASIGSAIFDAKTSLPLNYQQANINWTLLGDPTLPLQ